MPAPQVTQPLDPIEALCRLVPPAPAWWRWASCRGAGPGEWLVEQGDVAHLRELRAVCRACPVRGHCLRDALTEPLSHRQVGPVRVGMSGRSWPNVARSVRLLAPSTPSEWIDVADLVLDAADRLGSRGDAW